jgi:CubicO group peptidase (beta-lactamase class C family)
MPQRASLALALAVNLIHAPLAKAYSTDELKQDKLAQLPGFVDGVAATEIAAHGVAGAAVTVTYKGEVILDRGYGYADIDRHIPVDPQKTLFRIGSITKLLTWTAVMQQVELGRIDLNVDISKYLDFDIPRTSLKPITMLNLMAHSAGFNEQYNIHAEDVAHFVPYAKWIKENIPAQIREPGIEVQYSNYGAALAGYIVQRVSGEPYERYVENHIFHPLGMTDATLQQPLTGPRVASGYRVVSGHLVAKPFEMDEVVPAGAASATAADMMRFAEAILNDGRLGPSRILKSDSVRVLESDLLANAPDLPGLAHGFFVEREAGPRMVKHGGDTMDQHSELILAPEADFGVFVAVTGGADAPTARSEIMGAIIGRLFPETPAKRWTGTETPAPTGIYRSDRRDYTKPPNSESDFTIVASGPHAITLTQGGKTTYWEQIKPHIYELVTGARDGGPYDQLEFSGPLGDERMSIASRPAAMFRHIKSPPAGDSK